MALTVTSAPAAANLNVYDALKFVTARATFDNSYATGGLALTPATLGLNKILAVVPYIRTNTSVLAGQATHASYDATNQKLQLWKLNAEVAAATDCSLVVCDLLVIGV